MSDEGEIRWLGDMVRLKPELGDVFVLQCPRRLSPEQRERLRDQWQRLMGDVMVLIMEDGIRLGVVNATPAAPPPMADTTYGCANHYYGGNCPNCGR